MENTEFMGIVFTSDAHLRWFELSMWLLAGHLACQVIRRFLHPSPHRHPEWIFVAFHGGTALNALLYTRMGMTIGQLYSPACIWFNTLMVLVHLVVMWLGIRWRCIRWRRGT